MSDNDLAGGELPRERISVVNYEIQTHQQLLKFRNVVFWSSISVIVIFYVSLLVFIICKAEGVGKDGGVYLAITITIVLATVPTLTALTLMRSTFNNTSGKQDSDDFLMTQALFKEAMRNVKLPQDRVG